MQLRVERIPQGVAKQVEAEHAQADGDPGEERDPGRLLRVGQGGPGEHQPPRGRRLRRAQAQIAERRLGQDGAAQLRRHDDDERRQDVGDDVLQDDPAPHRAQRLHGLDVLVLLHRERGGPHDPRRSRDDRDGDGDHDVLHGRTEDRGNGQGQDQLREREENVHDALQEQIHPSTRVRADDTQQAADRAARERRREADEQGDARSIHHAAQHVAAELVGPEPVLRARPGELRRVVGLVRVVRRERSREQGDEQHPDDDQRTDGAERLRPDELHRLLTDAEARRQGGRGRRVHERIVDAHPAIDTESGDRARRTSDRSGDSRRRTRGR